MDWQSFWAYQDWGSVPEWFGAVGTIAAVALALYSNKVSRKQLQKAQETAELERAEAAEDRRRFREQREREELAERRRAASRVSLVATPEPWYDRIDQPSMTTTIEVLNGGSEPIRLVTIAARKLQDPPPPEPTTMIPGNWGTIEGHAKRSARHLHAKDSRWGFEVQFTDQNDVRWVLDEYGKLVELNTDTARAVKMMIL